MKLYLRGAVAISAGVLEICLLNGDMIGWQKLSASQVMVFSQRVILTLRRRYISNQSVGFMAICLRSKWRSALGVSGDSPEE